MPTTKIMASMSPIQLIIKIYRINIANYALRQKLPHFGYIGNKTIVKRDNDLFTRFFLSCENGTTLRIIDCHGLLADCITTMLERSDNKFVMKRIFGANNHCVRFCLFDHAIE